MERINQMELVAKYFGKTVEQCNEYACSSAYDDYQGKWLSKPRKTEKQCREFYLNNEMSVYRQAFYRKGSQWHFFTDHIKPEDKVLDYGCGIAQPLQCFIDNNPRPDITLADVPSSTFEYAKWRYGDKAKYIAITNNHPLKEKYDWIICLDALEHIPKAYKVFKHIFKHLKPGGNLIFWYETAPSASHLIKSTRKNRPKAYYFLLRKAMLYGTFFSQMSDQGIVRPSCEWWVKDSYLMPSR